MARRFIDISVTLENGIKSDPDFMIPRIKYDTHEKTTSDICAFFPGLTKNELPEAQGWAVETITLSTHNGTHVDAPWHYHPTMDGGTRAIAIDEVPLEWFFQRGVKLDFRHFPNGYVVEPSDIETELRRIRHILQPLDIVVVNTAAGACYGSDDYLATGCGFGRNSTLWLTDVLRCRACKKNTSLSWDSDAVEPHATLDLVLGRLSHDDTDARAVCNSIPAPA